MRKLNVLTYDEQWPIALGKVVLKIRHVGSTSVPGLAANPVIDILLEVVDLYIGRPI